MEILHDDLDLCRIHGSRPTRASFPLPISKKIPPTPLYSNPNSGQRFLVCVGCGFGIPSFSLGPKVCIAGLVFTDNYVDEMEAVELTVF